MENMQNHYFNHGIHHRLEGSTDCNRQAMETTYMVSLGSWGASDSSYNEHGTWPEKLKHRWSKQLFVAGDENDMDLLSCFGLPGSSLFRFWRRLLDLGKLVLQEPELALPSSPASSVFWCLVLLSLLGVPFSSAAFAVEDPKKKNLFMVQKCGRLTEFLFPHKLCSCIA